MKLTADEEELIRETYLALGPQTDRPALVFRWLNAMDATASHGDMMHQLKVIGYDPGQTFTVDHALRYLAMSKARVSMLPSTEELEKLAVFSAYGGDADGAGTINIDAVKSAMEAFALSSDFVAVLAAESPRRKTSLQTLMEGSMRANSFKMPLTRRATFQQFSAWVDEQLSGTGRASSELHGMPSAKDGASRHVGAAPFDHTPSRDGALTTAGGATTPQQQQQSRLKNHRTTSPRHREPCESTAEIKQRADDALRHHRKGYERTPSTTVKLPRQLPPAPQLIRRLPDPKLVGTPRQPNPPPQTTDHATPARPKDVTGRPATGNARTPIAVAPAPGVVTLASTNTSVVVRLVPPVERHARLKAEHEARQPPPETTAHRPSHRSVAILPKQDDAARRARATFFADQSLFTQPFRAEYRAANMASAAGAFTPRSEAEALAAASPYDVGSEPFESDAMSRWTT